MNQFQQETSPFTKYFLEQEKNYRSPVFARESRDDEFDAEVCKKLNFEAKSPQGFQVYSPVPQQTLKKAPIFLVSPRQVFSDKHKTEQRLVNCVSPISQCAELGDDEFQSDEQQSPVHVPGSKSPERKHSTRAKNMKYIGFITLTKRCNFQSEQTRRKSNSKRRRPILTEQKSKVVMCNCKKSKCLKLYCDCFAAGGVCGKDCNCNNCHNNDEHSKEREHVISTIVERNPSAFRSKVESRVLYSQTKSHSEEEAPAHKPRHFKGCNCKKSNCLKKYCECYQMGVKCSELCKCDDCKNCEVIHKKDSKKKIKF